jgi:glycerol-3-phosphate dehydrogenase
VPFLYPLQHRVRERFYVGSGIILVGASQYYDGLVDDARHTMMVARTAAHHGALVATSARVTG